MPKRTQFFQQVPWIGGLNTSVDPSMIPSNEAIQIDNIVFDTRESKKKRPGIDMGWDNASSAAVSVIGQADFWYGSTSKTQRQFAVFDNKKMYSYLSDGTRSEVSLDGGATAWGSTISQASFIVMNNLLIICVDGSSNKVRKWAGGALAAFDLGGTPPAASICQQHLGRVWMNDKTNPDRIHYSTTGNPEEWNGTGDSGALDIGVGDGDPVGITAIFPSYKGALYVAKRGKLYVISGTDPESFLITQVTSGLGCVSHNAAFAVDETDVIFTSERGFHSLAATQAYGDFSTQFISDKIQKTFRDNFPVSRLPYIRGGYLPGLNSIVFAVTDSTITSSENKALYFYNLAFQSWYRWPNISCQSLCISSDTDKKRAYLGSSTGRIYQTLQTTNYDMSEAGANVSIPYTIKTGLLPLDGSLYSRKGLKKFTLFYKPTGTHTITASIKIDNYPPQSVSFSQKQSTDLLGTTFVLGVSKLGYESTMSPYTKIINGHGRTVQLTLSASGVDEPVEIQGFGFEFEQEGTKQEVLAT